jgi:hypothetical protein
MPFPPPPSPVRKKAPQSVSKERKDAIEELAGYLGESPDKLLPISQQEKEAIISTAIETPEGRSMLAITLVEAIDEQR